MTTSTDSAQASALSPSAQHLLDIAVTRSARDAAAFVLRELDGGRTAATLVTEVLAPVQAEVGERWQRNLMTAGDEHAATAIIDNALATLAVTAPLPRVPDQGSMAVVCAHGDWHTLPARMAAELWRWEGWDVLFLGGSLPPADLGSWLASSQPDVLAVSCSVALYLPGALRVAEAAAGAGVPCVVGGSGLGTDSRRAAALGVRWAGTPAGLAAALAAPMPTVQPAGLAGRRQEADELNATADEIIDAAMRGLADRLPASRSYTARQLAQTKQDFRYLIGFLAAAVLCDDPPLFTDSLDWLQSVVTGRHVPPVELKISVAVLVEALPATHLRAHALCRTAVGAL